jgi:Peptidase MA superfamily
MKHSLAKIDISCLLLISAVLSLLGAHPVAAQEPITVDRDEHSHIFQGDMTFRLSVHSTSPITSVKLFYRPAGQTAAHRVDLEFTPATSVQVEHSEDMGKSENYQPPMITFTYWWVIEDREGNRLKTDPVSFVYEDTRYTWQVKEGERVRLYWHDRGADVGQAYFDLAERAAADLASQFGVTPKDPVTIVLYNSHEELMSVLQEASAEWTGAVNFGETGIIAIELGPADWMEKVIPHELTHAMLEQVTQPPFGQIPRWLHEGLAMHSEGGMGSEERSALRQAIRDDSLISLRVLNSPFADAREQAILSYAESNSLVEFIIDEYGAGKLGQLIAVFAEGAHYDDAMMEVFGVDMDGMEDLWRASIGAQPRKGTTAVGTPAATPGFDATPEGTATIVVSTPTEAPATAVSAASTSTATPVTTSLPPTTTPAPRTRAPCLGAAPALAVLALFAVLLRRKG